MDVGWSHGWVDSPVFRLFFCQTQIEGCLAMTVDSEFHIWNEEIVSYRSDLWAKCPVFVSREIDFWDSGGLRQTCKRTWFLIQMTCKKTWFWSLNSNSKCQKVSHFAEQDAARRVVALSQPKAQPLRGKPIREGRQRAALLVFLLGWCFENIKHRDMFFWLILNWTREVETC